MEAYKICLFVSLPHVHGSLMVLRTVVSSDVCVCVYARTLVHAWIYVCACVAIYSRT